MSLESLLRVMCRLLAESNIPFMLTGSVAAGYRGAGRATMDVDAVIDPSRMQLDTLVGLLGLADLYVSSEAAREALVARSMFNVIDPATGWKADLIVRKARPFSDSEFARREPATLLGIDLTIVSLEDLIVSKLEWASLGGSARQLDDVRTLLRINAVTLDRAYVERWVSSLGIEDMWSMVRPAVD